PYMGVPCVSPKEVLQLRQPYRCRPRWLPLRTTWDSRQFGLGHGGRLASSFLSASFIGYLLPLFYHLLLESLPDFDTLEEVERSLASVPSDWQVEVRLETTMEG